MTNQSTIGARIKISRKENGLSQAALAELAGLPQSTISAIETGRYVSTRKLFTVSKCLGVSMSWITGDQLEIEANRSNRNNGIPIDQILNLKTTGERVSQVRMIRGMTQQELADKSGVSQSTLASLEINRNKSCNKIHKIAEILQVDIRLLYEGKVEDSLSNCDVLYAPDPIVPKKPSYIEIIGQNLKICQMRRGISTKMLCKKSGVTSHDFLKLMDGNLDTSMKTIVNLAKTLGVEDLLPVAFNPELDFEGIEIESKRKSNLVKDGFER